MDCSGIIQKIHMRKIWLDQRLVHDEEFLFFYVLGTFDEAKWTLQGPGVRADAQRNITWLEELASESKTIQAQEK